MVGIGMMGHGIASNLVKHGHALTVLEHPGNQPLGRSRPPVRSAPRARPTWPRSPTS
jgi:3-hydroxyacyl-CoA dehydrogenase